MIRSFYLKKRYVKLKSEKVDLETGLAKSSTFEWVNVTAIDSNDVIQTVKTEAPVDGEEVVEWMQNCASDQIVLDALEEEYSTCSARGAGRIASASGDGYIPGVRVAGLRVVSWEGSYVRRRGYCVVRTPRGSFRIPVGRKALFARDDVLAWGCVPWCGRVQFDCVLMRWLDLAEAPINRRVRFASVRGRVAPNFFKVSTSIPTPVCIMRIGLTSNRSQKVLIRVRGKEGSYHRVLQEDTVEIDKGESEVVYDVMAFPTVPTFTLEIQPQDGTKTILDYLDVIP